MFLHIFHLAHGVGYLKMPSTVFEDALEAEEWAKNDQNLFLKQPEGFCDQRKRQQQYQHKQQKQQQ